MILNTAHASAFSMQECRAACDRIMAKSLFFIGGFPKSGTTWLQLILNAHPMISCRGEGHFLNQLAPTLRAAIEKYNALIALKNNSVLSGVTSFPLLTEMHFHSLLTFAIALQLDAASDPASAIVGEKTPDNLMYFDILAVIFTSAKFVHIVRDPRDCAVSGWFHNLRLNAEGTHQRFDSFDAYTKKVAATWLTIMERGSAFISREPGRCLVLRYEDMIENPRETLGALLCFLGADATPELVEACGRAAAFETVTQGRERGQEDRQSFFRRGIAHDWPNHFTEQENRDFLNTCGPAMAQYGYR